MKTALCCAPAMTRATTPWLDGDLPHDAAPPRRERSARATHLAHVGEHAGHFLPAQGPIRVFIHHNTLHAFEDLNFDDGVTRGAKLFGCQPYLSEDRYREKLAQGRITVTDLLVELLED